MTIEQFLSNYLIFLIPCIILAIFVGWSRSPHGKGVLGELKIKRTLGKNIANEKYVINNLYILDNQGKSSQIDHVLINSKGVFVIETKNYSGRIYGNENQLEWTQVLQYGKVKNKLYNPVKQNATHIYKIKNAINLSIPFFSIVVFIRADIDNVKASNVYNISGMKKFISGVKSNSLSSSQITDVYNKLISIKDTTAISSREHIQNIEKLKTDINTGICPRCGGKLIERSGKNGKFLGCSNYPKCKFTKKI